MILFKTLPESSRLPVKIHATLPPQDITYPHIIPLPVNVLNACCTGVNILYHCNRWVPFMWSFIIVAMGLFYNHNNICLVAMRKFTVVAMGLFYNNICMGLFYNGICFVTTQTYYYNKFPLSYQKTIMLPIIKYIAKLSPSSYSNSVGGWVRLSCTE